MRGDTRVGPYRILRLINRGGQGSVYLGYDARLRRRVAIKIYDLPAGRAARNALLQEARTIASLDSPRIVQVHDIIESLQHVALVMEYVAGCDLAEFLAVRQPSLSSVLTIAADIATALAVARQQHIVHGDIKPANVLIADNGRVKLTDFGIARGVGQTDSRQSSGASLVAMSPELYRGEALDVRSDLFVLGCLIYRMLGGESPFFSAGQLDVQWLLQRPPLPLEDKVPADLDVPPQLLALVAQLLQKNPQQRPRNTHQVRKVLRDCARAMPLSQGNNLLREARPCFRGESPEDIPPQVPGALGRAGRSVLGRGGVSNYWTSLSHRSRRTRSFAAVSILCLVIVAALSALQQGQTRIYIAAPTLRLQQAQALPTDLSVAWVVEEVKTALGEQLGGVHVSGPVGATPLAVYHAGEERSQGQTQQQTEEQFDIDLRCAAEFCAFAISREYAGGQRHRQALLFPDMPLERWSDIIREATLALY